MFSVKLTDLSKAKLHAVCRPISAHAYRLVVLYSVSYRPATLAYWPTVICNIMGP